MAENRLIPYSPKSHRLNAILRGSQIIKKGKITQNKKTIYHKILSLHIFIQSKEAKSSFLSNKIVVSIIPNSFLQGSKKRFQVHF